VETVIVDAGPLVAYLRADDADHAWVAERFREFREPLLTCDAVLSEAFFLLRGISSGRLKLLGLLDRGIVVPAFDLGSEISAVGKLMLRYENVPMSLADACLVRMAEVHSDARVFTLDADFHVYRRNRRGTIPLIFPGASLPTE